MPRNFSDNYKGNSKLKGIGVKQDFTLEQLREYQKCAADPIYFIRNYVKIVNVDKGVIPFNLYPFQEEMIRLFRDNRFSISKIGRQSGKCLVKTSRLNIRDRNSGREYETTIEQLYKAHKKGKTLLFLSSIVTRVLGSFKKVLQRRMRPTS
jgi:hypothetical protein